MSHRDGWFRVLDFRSGKLLFATRATGTTYVSGAWEFKPVIRTGDYLIVQPEGEIIVLKLAR